MARSEEEVLSGLLPVAIGGVVKRVPVLKIRAAREWKEALAVSLARDVGSMDIKSLDSLGAVGNMAGDKILELVLAYDTSGALGGREWIEEHGDDTQVYTAFRAMLEVSFPFVNDLRSAMGQLREVLGLAAVNQAAGSLPAKSPNSPSPNGASTPRFSPAGSPTSS